MFFKGEFDGVSNHHTIKTHEGNGSGTSCILNLSTRWRKVITFMLWLFYHHKNQPSVLIGLGQPQSLSECSNKEKFQCFCQELNLNHTACRQSVTVLSQLLLYFFELNLIFKQQYVDDEENYIMLIFINLYSSPVIVSLHMKKQEMPTKFWLKETS
jgi:hypothetical protein